MRRAYAVGPSVRSTSRTSSSRSRGRVLPGPTTCQEPSISKCVCSVRPPREAGQHVLAVRVERRHDLPRQVGRGVLRDAEVGRDDGAPDQLLAQATGGLPDAVTLRHPVILPPRRGPHPARDDARPVGRTARGVLRGTVALDRAGLQGRDGLRTALGVGVPLLVGLALDRPLDGLAAAGGAFSAGFAVFATGYRTRLSAMLLAAVGVAVSTFVGALVAGSLPLLSLAVVVWGLAAGMLVSLGVAAGIVGLQSVIGLLLITQFAMPLAGRARPRRPGAARRARAGRPAADRLAAAPLAGRARRAGRGLPLARGVRPPPARRDRGPARHPTSGGRPHGAARSAAVPARRARAACSPVCTTRPSGCGRRSPRSRWCGAAGRCAVAGGGRRRARRAWPPMPPRCSTTSPRPPGWRAPLRARRR